MFDNINVNLRKNEVFLTSIPCTYSYSGIRSFERALNLAKHWSVKQIGEHFFKVRKEG